MEGGCHQGISWNQGSLEEKNKDTNVALAQIYSLPSPALLGITGRAHPCSLYLPGPLAPS